MEIDGKSGQAVEYVADPAGRLISSLYLSNPSTQASDSRYFQYDGLGNVISRTNQQGNAVTSYSYEAFGAITSQSGQLGNAYTYMGQAYDASTGLYYMNARWYDPQVGRFITADPLPGNPFQSGSTNRYAYALDNPIMFEDTSGLTPASKSTRNAQSAQTTSEQGIDWFAIAVIGLAVVALVAVILALILGLALPILGWLLIGMLIGLVLGAIAYALYLLTSGESFSWRDLAVWMAIGLLIGAIVAAVAYFFLGYLAILGRSIALWGPYRLMVQGSGTVLGIINTQTGLRLSLDMPHTLHKMYWHIHWWTK